MAEKITRKIEMDEEKNFDIHIRETTHIVDDQTGEIIYRAVKHHRKVIECGDDAGAAAEGVDNLSSQFWTAEIRAKKEAKKNKEPI